MMSVASQSVRPSIHDDEGRYQNTKCCLIFMRMLSAIHYGSLYLGFPPTNKHNGHRSKRRREETLLEACAWRTKLLRMPTSTVGRTRRGAPALPPNNACQLVRVAGAKKIGHVT
jgi:hypothetical protein